MLALHLAYTLFQCANPDCAERDEEWRRKSDPLMHVSLKVSFREMRMVGTGRLATSW
jgi:hypothetical protein